MSVITPKIMVLIGFIVLIIGLFITSVMIMNSPEEIAKNQEALRRRAALEGTLQQVNELAVDVHNTRHLSDFEQMQVVGERARRRAADSDMKENMAAWNIDRMPEEYQRKAAERRAALERMGGARAAGSAGSQGSKRIDGVYYPGDIPTEPPSSGVSGLAVAISGIGGLGVTAVVGALVFALVGGKDPEEDGVAADDTVTPPEPPPFEPPPIESPPA